ncbi:MAG: 3-hydroxyacyl-CoA dehydrogenase [Gammaproteobacteria bacterium RIFCSPLOWO2_02_FULL_61_13]|nr:MAG: 3-hydroxyacyl-CoA dehydrogenase [Gammaproteobacteria bacterium RIFCSPLOWO2_02_FULL_61_13]
MKDFSKDPVVLGIVGAGIMGRGIAQVAAAAGMEVLLFDTNSAMVQTAWDFVGSMFARAAEKGRMTSADANAASKRVHPAAALVEFSRCDLVIEAIIEKLEVKQPLFRELEAIVPDHCILATNTSSLSVTEIAAGCRRPERVAGCHFFNPVPLMKLVEVIGGERTDSRIVAALETWVKRTGHTPVPVVDSPGFLVNHVGRGLVTEGLRILFENITETHVVDRIMRDCAGFRMGPFELMDLTGLDVTFPVSEQVYNQFFHEPRLKPTPMQRRRYLAGLLGRKSGRGFYAYDGDDRIEPPEPAVPPVAKGAKFWVSRAQPILGKKLKLLLRETGMPLDNGKKPGRTSIALVTPLGLDATTATLDEKLPPARTLAVDMLLETGKRITLMPTPATGIDVINSAWAALGKGGRTVSVIRDSGGFVGQRMVATIINTACDVAQQGIAAPANIDVGAKLGLGYPKGPLELGDAVGPAVVLEILEGLQRVYADPRYRPSPWLSRRARLGMSLLEMEHSM